MKNLEFTLYPNIIVQKEFFKARFCNLSFIRLILDSIDIMKIENIHHSSHHTHQNKLILFNNGKKSRLIFYASDKMFSVYFPFSITKDYGDIKIYFKEYELSDETVSFLKSILNNFSGKFSLDEEALLDEISEEYVNFKGSENDASSYLNKVLEIFKELLSSDTGYIRYDHDKNNSSELHPIDHLDIFFSDSSSIKIGLNKKYGLQEFLSILDNTYNIKYIDD